MRIVLSLALFLASSMAFAEKMKCTGSEGIYSAVVDVSDIKDGDGTEMAYVVKITKSDGQTTVPVIDTNFPSNRLVYGRGIAGIKDNGNIEVLRMIFDGTRAVLQFQTKTEAFYQLPVSCSDQPE